MDARQARRYRVGNSNRDQHCRQDESSEDIMRKPRRLISTEGFDSRQPVHPMLHWRSLPDPAGLAGHAHALAAIDPSRTQSRLLRPSASGKLSHVRSFASIFGTSAACPARVKLAILTARRPFPIYPASCANQADTTRETSVVAGNRLAGVQTLAGILRPPLRLGNLRQVYVDLLIWDTVEQMPDQV